MLQWGLARQRLAAARHAARAGTWPEAAKAYAAFLDVRPRNAAAWVQYGHAQKAIGELAGARSAYERAIALAPNVPDTWLQLAAVLRRLGDRTAAIDCCVRALTIDPNFEAATEELLGLGGRDRLPGGISHHQGDENVPGQAPWLEALVKAQTGDVYAPARYHEYRRSLTIPTPPARPRLDQPIAVMIDAQAALPVDVRATLSSLRDQTDPSWTAVVIGPATIGDHSIASLAALDPRIVFVQSSVSPTTSYMLLARAGTVLDRQAIAWFSYTAAHTGCCAAYADHDHCIDDWRTGRRHDTPLFQPMFDPDWFADADMCPALLLINSANFDITLEASLQRLRKGRNEVAHIPLLLASIKAMSLQALRAQAEPAYAGQTHAHPTVPRLLKASSHQIHVVIQTRDAPELLRDAIDSLHRLAARPDLLRITIVDNRSNLPSTARLLARYAARGIAHTIALDEPFNWSRANNLAVADSDAPVLLFLNNDTTSLTSGWDAALHDILADPDVGAVGAMLLYPDQSIQHAGMIFGIGSGGPVHEGIGHSARDRGPSGRWSRARSAAAVTGAFLAVRRHVFEDIGGFDAVELSIAFNDVDLCLRIREAGYRVIQTPTIRLIHHESKTRGLNVTRSQVAWDLEELAVVHRRWGAALFEDPGYNPHWTRIGQPFDGYRFPSLSETLSHIERSARADPWQVTAHASVDG
ncbi:GT2 family glycosyltransferase [Sphingomonas sp. PP-F2F-G114-C0414]|uniref:glycosyltransferase family 2 protein n=1 Tax=Sphingomonas sp. PP-F2F-G114-C0414 TaxID=2135662 RepID=UPI000EF86457|nr:tetratricopeptide repeat protein [Sphingomonas sp. PP-F2F-G114-C0414]RMB25754.1 GT2 family glycosyltransferase [Sphingomonas sp. PP-F2F-G114-C0414]